MWNNNITNRCWETGKESGFPHPSLLGNQKVLFKVIKCKDKSLSKSYLKVYR